MNSEINSETKNFAISFEVTEIWIFSFQIGSLS
jgi:hypothetical protein